MQLFQFLSTNFFYHFYHQHMFLTFFLLSQKKQSGFCPYQGPILKFEKITEKLENYQDT